MNKQELFSYNVLYSYKLSLKLVVMTAACFTDTCISLVLIFFYIQEVGWSTITNQICLEFSYIFGHKLTFIKELIQVL